MSISESVRLAMRRVEHLGAGGPNHYSVKMDGWWVSAPTKKRLRFLLRRWFKYDAA